ncbi:BtpA/SgcQ family protein [Bdellovibrionota bacterium FG-1]
MKSLPRLPSLIGVIHLPPLAGTPGSANANEALQKAGLRAVQEAKALTDAGFDGLILENFGDVPFYKTQVPPETVASMAIIAAAVREATKILIGINVLRNDARAALAIAAVSGCDFIRVHVLSGVSATDQGLIEGDAAFLLRERDRLGAPHIAILADALVKHARTFSTDQIELAIEEVVLRAGAQGAILTGTTTGRPVDMMQLEKASNHARKHGIPLYIGSGATQKNILDLRKWATGIIVGSALRKGGKAGAPLDLKATRAFAKVFFSRRGKTQGKSGAKR